MITIKRKETIYCKLESRHENETEEQIIAKVKSGEYTWDEDKRIRNQSGKVTAFVVDEKVAHSQSEYQVDEYFPDLSFIRV